MGAGGYSNIKVYICAALGLKMRGLREQPLTENGGGGVFSELPHTGKGFWS